VGDALSGALDALHRARRSAGADRVLTHGQASAELAAVGPPSFQDAAFSTERSSASGL
jgi:hypothetical protein